MGHLVVLRHLDGLSNPIQVDAYDSGLVAWHSVRGTRDSVLRAGVSTAAAAADTDTTTDAVSPGGLLFLQQDLSDLLEELRVDVLALGGLVSVRDGSVSAAAAAAAADEAASAAAADEAAAPT